jgi:RNA polymerase sigma-70 factor (ECF subfamily)
MTASAESADLLARAVAGDDAAFAILIQPHERSVFRHCYRMFGSGADAEDATQDTLERAWRRLTTYDGSGPFGAWLHRIATNVCLDALRRRRARIGPGGYGQPMQPGAAPVPPDPELAWVEPVSDAELTGAGRGAGAGDPQDELVRREEISLAFVAALQRLAPRQRAALLLHDVLGFSHAEVSDVLGVSASAVNSLLSRARAAARESSGAPQPDVTDPRVRQLLERYVQAWRLADIDGFVRLVTEDVCFSMPPMSMWFSGRDAAAAFIEDAIFGPARPGGIRLVAGSCNGQPAFAAYAPDASGRLLVNGLQVLQLSEVGGSPLISALVSYRDAAIAIRCGLPEFIS